MHMRRAGLQVVLNVGLLGGCGKDATGPSSFGPLRVLAGMDAADTVLAPLPQALVVEVRDEDGQPLEGTVVRFEGNRQEPAHRELRLARRHDIDLHSPAWSPTDDLIAFVASSGEKLHTVSPDGTGEKVVGDPVSWYDFGIDWSPDERWLIARNSSHERVELTDVLSGGIMPLKFTSGYRGPSWKP